MQGTKLAMSPAYYPQTDRQTEVTNRTLEQYLRCFVHQNPQKWEEFLPWAEYWYNTTFHASIKRSPFEIVYGRVLLYLMSYPMGESPNEEVDRELYERDLMLHELKQNLGVSISRMKEQSDKGQREENFQVGEWVYLKLWPYRQQSISQKALYKLGSRYYGPFQVLEKIGEVAYKVSLPPDAHIHPVIHVSQLKQRLGEGEVVMGRLPAVATDGGLIIRPLRAVEYRQVKRGGRFRWEVLIEWKTLPSSEATWESWDIIKERFSKFILEDKDNIEGGRNDTDEGRWLKNAYNRARRARIRADTQRG